MFDEGNPSRGRVPPKVTMLFNPMRQPVLLYDGECGLCNWSVRMLLRADKTGRLHYAPLQSEPAQAYVRDWNIPDRCEPLLRTDGALAAAAEVGGILRVVSWLRILPGWLRDPCYKLVARSRYALFGAYRPSPLPNPEWEKRFLAR